MINNYIIVFVAICLAIGAIGCSKGAQQGAPRTQAVLSAINKDTQMEVLKPVFTCGALTKQGKSCRKRVSKEGTRCWIHKGADSRAGVKQVLYTLRGEGGSEY